MPEGPLGGPRPLSSCDIVIEASGGYSSTRVGQRDLEWESEIRERTGLTIDVVETNGAMKYILREDFISLDEFNTVIETVEVQTGTSDLFISTE